MAKKILFQGIPSPGVLSENFGAVFPETIDQQENGAKIIGADLHVPYDPSSGSFGDPMLYNPATGRAELQRTMTAIKHSADITVIGQTAIWTPAANKRVRVMGFSIVVDPATTSVAGSVITLQDGATDLDDFLILGITAPAVPLRWQCPLPANGYLSSTIGGVINVSLSAALTAGRIRVNVWGCEE